MQCQRCQFENMPGQQRCFKCNSILEDQKSIVDVHPPRMPSWQRPFRRVLRMLRRSKVAPDRDKSLKMEWDWFDTYKNAIWPLILSVIPGLAHVKQRRFRAVRWFMAAWLLCMVFACAMFSSSWGWMALGLAAAIHAWIALDAGLWKILDSVTNRLYVLMATFVILFACYGLLIRVMPWNFEFWRTPIRVPSEEIRQGDILLFRPVEDIFPTLTRGTVVQYRSRIIGQIVGLPNEVVSVHESVYYVNGIELSSEAYPMPAWIRDSDQGVTVGPAQYYISTELRVLGRHAQMNDAWRLCLVSTNDIESRATMLWWPLQRRHSLRQD